MLWGYNFLTLAPKCFKWARGHKLHKKQIAKAGLSECKMQQ